MVNWIRLLVVLVYAVTQTAAGSGARQEMTEISGYHRLRKKGLGHPWIAGEKHKKRFKAWESNPRNWYLKGKTQIGICQRAAVVRGMNSWRKWPREPAGHCKYRANIHFLEHTLSLSKDYCIYKQVPGQKNGPEMHKRSHGLPWPHFSAAESTAAQWSKNLFSDTGQQCHVEKSGYTREDVVPVPSENLRGCQKETEWMNSKKAVCSSTFTHLLLRCRWIMIERSWSLAHRSLDRTPTPGAR